MDACRVKQGAVRRVSHREQEVAASCGLPLVFTLPHLMLSPAYDAFLERLGEACAEKGAMFRPAEKELVLEATGGFISSSLLIQLNSHAYCKNLRHDHRRQR